MKIGIASDDKQHISRHFGRSRGFVIADVQENAVRSTSYKMNDFTHHSQHGHGESHGGHNHNHDGILKALESCEVVISRGMGRRIYEDLQAAGIQPVITDLGEVEAALQAYIRGTLDDHPDRGCSH